MTDLRRGFDGLSAQVQNVLHEQPFSGHMYLCSADDRGDIVETAGGMAMVCAYLRSVLSVAASSGRRRESGTVHLSRAQLSMLLEGTSTGAEWNATWTPEVAV